MHSIIDIYNGHIDINNVFYRKEHHTGLNSDFNRTVDSLVKLHVLVVLFSLFDSRQD